MRTSHLVVSAMRSAALALLLGLGVSCTEPTTEPPSAPEAAVGIADKGLSFRQVSAGNVHTCGVTTGNVAYCWGENVSGQLGDGTFNNVRTRPVRVLGGLAFRFVSAGDQHTCGVTTTNVAYCWGRNEVGQLGTGSSTGSTRRAT